MWVCSTISDVKMTKQQCKDFKHKIEVDTNFKVSVSKLIQIKLRLSCGKDKV